MNKYTKIVPFDVGTERPTEEYAELLKTQNTALLEMLNNLTRWVGKSIADGAYSDCVNPERAMVDLERATEALSAAKET